MTVCQWCGAESPYKTMCPVCGGSFESPPPRSPVPVSEPYSEWLLRVLVFMFGLVLVVIGFGWAFVVVAVWQEFGGGALEFLTGVVGVLVGAVGLRIVFWGNRKMFWFALAAAPVVVYGIAVIGEIIL